MDTSPGPIDDEEELKDHFCDPDNPVIVQFQDVSAAAYKIKSGIERTPCPVSMGTEIVLNSIFLFIRKFSRNFGYRLSHGGGLSCYLVLLSTDRKTR